MYLAANLKFLRKKMGKTQDALSSEVNIGRTTIANYEAGISEPNVDNLLSFAKYFGISLDALLSKNLEKEGFLKENVNSDEKDTMLRAAIGDSKQVPLLPKGYSGIPQVVTVDSHG